MKQEGHLQSFELCLTTRAPLYVGSGNKIKKPEYVFDPATGVVRMINTDRLFALLIQKGLVDDYEKFVFSGKFSGDTGLYEFLKGCGVSEQDIDSIALYKVKAGDALDKKHSLKDIHTFQRNTAKQAFVPGNAVKGALRTVLLNTMMEREIKGDWPDPVSPGEHSKRVQGDIDRQMQELEGKYLNTLSLKKNKNGSAENDPVNSILRGISISDSAPISEKSMVLVGKYDVRPDGTAKSINVCRECVKPGTRILFTLTLDQSVLHGKLDKNTIMDMLSDFNLFYDDNYLSYFRQPRGDAGVSYRNCLIVGGGSGLFSKNLAYVYLGESGGVEYVANEMMRQFKNHKHDLDMSKYNVSPHTLKYGRYNGRLYPYGICEVSIV